MTIRSRRAQEAAYYGAVAVVVCVVVFVGLQLWRADVRVPFAYSADALSNGAITRGMVDTGGWYLTNPAVGLPGELDMRDFPQADGAHYAAMWMIGRIAGDWAVTVNVYYLLAFALIGLAAAWCFRRMGLSRPVALLASVLFAVLPYHFFRGEDHLFLGAYYAVPLASAYCYDAVRGVRGFIYRDADRAWRLVRRDALVAGAVVLIVGSGGVYYAFFACALLVSGALVGWARTRDRSVLVTSAALVAGIALVVLLNILPSVAYRLQEGPNTGLGGRNPGAAEVYGLKIDQMFLPADGHRVPAFAAIKRAYREGLRQMGPYMENESLGSSLGLLGTVGLVVLIVVGVLRAGAVRVRAGPGPDLPALSTLTLLSLLLGTVGGFGAILAVLLPQIRGYNRISVFIALFAFAALGAVLDRGFARAGAPRRAVQWSVVGALLVFGVWDQVTPAAVPDYQALSDHYSADRAFLKQVEAQLPEDAWVFQLPYMPWPEPGGPIEEMNDYDHFRAYLASNGRLRFSYGAMKGREVDAMQRSIAQEPPAQMVEGLRDAGFSAVWLDLAGVAEDERLVEALRAATGSEPLEDASGRFRVFVLDR